MKAALIACLTLALAGVARAEAPHPPKPGDDRDSGRG